MPRALKHFETELGELDGILKQGRVVFAIVRLEDGNALTGKAGDISEEETEAGVRHLLGVGLETKPEPPGN